MVLAGT